MQRHHQEGAKWEPSGRAEAQAHNTMLKTFKTQCFNNIGGQVWLKFLAVGNAGNVAIERVNDVVALRAKASEAGLRTHATTLGSQTATTSPLPKQAKGTRVSRLGQTTHVQAHGAG